VPKNRWRYTLPAVLISVVVLIAVGYSWVQKQPAKPIRQASNTTGTGFNTGMRETRPTLSPALFKGTVRAAYQIARDIPEVLDQLYCHCHCKENFNHISLLTCYVDNHAST